MPAFQRVYGWCETQITRLLSDLGAQSAARLLVLSRQHLSRQRARTRRGADRGRPAAHSDADHHLRRGRGTWRRTPSRPKAARCPRRAAGAGAAGLQVCAARPRRGVLPRMGAGARCDPPTAMPRTWTSTPPARPLGKPGQHHRQPRPDRERARELGQDGRRRLFADPGNPAVSACITADTLEDARNAYASTGSRGLAQSETDKLKAELLGDSPDEGRSRLALQWEECEARLGKERLAELFALPGLHRGRAPAPALPGDGPGRGLGLPGNVETFIERHAGPVGRRLRAHSEPQGEARAQAVKAGQHRRPSDHAHAHQPRCLEGAGNPRPVQAPRQKRWKNSCAISSVSRPFS